MDEELMVGGADSVRVVLTREADVVGMEMAAVDVTAPVPSTVKPLADKAIDVM